MLREHTVEDEQRILAGPGSIPVWWGEVRAAHADRVAVRDHGESTSYADLDRRSEALARGMLASGAGKGTRVGILMANSAEWLASWLACGRIGAISVALSTFSSPRELAYLLRQADIAFLFADRTYLRHDYEAKLEEALPGLAEADGAAALVLASCPFLRGVWFTSAPSRKWSRGTLVDLEDAGAASRTFTPEILTQIEKAVAPADHGLIMFTSGSTADPKAVVHTQATMVRKIRYMSLMNSIIPLNLQRDDRMLLTSPLFWVGGLLFMGSILDKGATMVREDDHSPKALAITAHAEKVTKLVGMEPVLRAVIAEPEFTDEDFARLTPSQSPQCPIFDPSLARDRLPNALGMTEAMGPYSGPTLWALYPPERAGSFGPGYPLTELKIIDPMTKEELPPGSVGELCIRGWWLMDGFYKRERRDVFEKDGFYRTGDLVRLDSDGHFYFQGRFGGMIKTSGANVSPDEVERVVLEQPGVLEVAVIGVPDPKLEQMVVAVIAPRPGETVDEAQVHTALRGALSSFKVPKKYLIMDVQDWPRTASAKVHKPSLLNVVMEKLKAG
jgi:acyl-CoA synthetase (AMP-forming)/AMP-acid ligase II